MSDRKKARRAVREFLWTPSIRRTPTPDELLHRRWQASRAVDLRVSHLSELLSSERAARKVARRVISEKLELQRAAQRNKDAFLRERAERLRRGQEISELQTENADLRNTVSELSRKIQDPPGSHERWQELRTSLSRAEDQIRTQAAQLLALPTAQGWKDSQDRVRALTAALAEERKRLELAERQRDHAREALRDSVRKGTPPPFVSAPGGLSAEDLRKVAEQFLATFSEATLPWLKGQK